MSITIREQRSQEWTIGARGNASRVWHIFGTLDISEAETAVLSVADASWVGLFRDVSNTKLKEMGYKAWEATVPYTPFDLSGGGEGTPPTTLSFRTSGGTTKVIGGDDGTGATISLSITLAQTSTGAASWAWAGDGTYQVTVAWNATLLKFELVLYKKISGVYTATRRDYLGCVPSLTYPMAGSYDVTFTGTTSVDVP